MEAEFSKEKILARVKKMMTLANDAAATEGERDNAIRMAHATLAKYNLHMADAEASGKPSEENRTGQHVVSRDQPWMRTTAHAIAELFFCEYFFISGRGETKGKVKHFFVGKESNVFTAQEMAKYVIGSISAEGRKKSIEMSDSAKGTYWRSFCKGAAYQVWVRCKKIREDAERAPKTPGTALVLASVYAIEKTANEKYMVDKMGGLPKEKKTTQRNTSLNAFAAGKDYGDKINLQRQIGGTSPDQKKIR